MNQTTIALKRELTIPEEIPGVPGTRPRYPFDQMDVSDYFAIPKPRSSLHSMAATLRRRHKAHPSKLFAIRVLADGREIVIRVQ
jgi:hypothetical protein